MIVGSGDIAKEIKDRDDLLFFASGVSNRNSLSYEETKREYDLLSKQEHQHIVYFSSLSVYYSDTPYAQHKRNMENWLRNVTLRGEFTIVRLGNITWGDNPNTLVNYLKHRIKNNLPYEVQDVYRYLLYKDELNHWLQTINPDFSSEMNIPGHRLKVKDIVKLIENGEL